MKGRLIASVLVGGVLVASMAALFLYRQKDTFGFLSKFQPTVSKVPAKDMEQLSGTKASGSIRAETTLMTFRVDARRVRQEILENIAGRNDWVPLSSSSETMLYAKTDRSYSMLFSEGAPIYLRAGLYDPSASCFVLITKRIE